MQVIRISKEIAKYFLDTDIHFKRFMLSEIELEDSLIRLRASQRDYKLWNGDVLRYHNQHWQILKRTDHG